MVPITVKAIDAEGGLPPPSSLPPPNENDEVLPSVTPDVAAGGGEALPAQVEEVRDEGIAGDTAVTTPPPQSSANTIPSSGGSSAKKAKSPRPRMGTKAKSAVSQLESETKCLLGRISAKGLKTTARRAAHRTPMLEELRRVGFEEYVRTEVLGVPLHLLGGRHANGKEKGGDKKTENDGDNANTTDGATPASTSRGEHPVDTTSTNENKEEKSKNGDKNMAAAATTPPPPPPPPAPTRQSSRIRERRKSGKATGPWPTTPRTPPPTDRGRTPSAPAAASSAPTPTRTSSRIRERRKHGILAGESPQGSGNGTTLPRSLIFGGRQSGGKNGRPKKPPPRMRLYPDPTNMSDGLCKITLPDGWWDRAGICGDTTARGPAWAPGTRLGDTVVTTPIKQCAGGIGGVFDFAMLEMPPMTVSEFREKADRYRKAQVGSEFDEDTSDEALDGLARKFWRRLGPTMEPAFYGADHEGTLFDGDDASGWNVDKLESCLSLLRADASNGDADEHVRLPGVTSAYLYFGMWASTFAAHTEDMGLLSINYLHAGSPKYWYAVSPDDSARFESLMASHFPSAAADCREFLRHKRYLLSPAQLTKAGIRYTTCVQRPGDAVVTIPGSYHFGFNTGFNVAESTNFAVPEWVPIGDASDVCLCHPHSVRIDMERFKYLLRKYEEDVDGMEMDGLDVGTVTYSEWAKYEARRIKQAKLAAIGGEASGAAGDEGEGSKKPKKGIVVEVLRLEVKKSPEEERRDRPRKKARKAGKAKDVEDWRLALTARPSVFLVTGTPVLCFVKAEGSGGGGNSPDEKENSGAAAAHDRRLAELFGILPSERCFSGTVVSAAEGHVRVHFAGSHRKADVWLPADSPKLFLDGGPESPPEGAGGAAGAKGKGR